MQKDTTILFDLDMTAVNWEGEGSMLKDIWEENFPELEFLGWRKSEKWNMADNYPQEYYYKISEIYKRPLPGFYLSMPPMPGFLEVLPELAELGHVAFVSTPISRSMFDTRFSDDRKDYVDNYNRVSKEKTCWIEEHIAPVLGRMPETLFVQDKSHAHGNVLFDDNPHVQDKVCMKPSWEHMLYLGEGEGFLFNRSSANVHQTFWSDASLIEKTYHAINSSKKILL